MNNALYTTSFVQAFSDVDSWRNDNGGQWFTGYQWDRSNPTAGDAAYYMDKSLALGNPVYDPFGTIVAGGANALTIAARPVSQVPGLSPADIEGYQYVSGLVSTGGQNVHGAPATTFTQRYGYYEVKVQLPKGQGIWPSFWMLDTYTRAEVDVFEFFGQIPTQIYQSIHPINGQPHAIPYQLGFDATAGFHRYGVLVTPTADVYYVDGVPTQQYPDASVNAFYFMVSLQIGAPGSFPGAPDATTPWPAIMSLQYFHAYQPTATTCSSGSSYHRHT